MPIYTSFQTNGLEPDKPVFQKRDNMNLQTIKFRIPSFEDFPFPVLVRYWKDASEIKKTPGIYDLYIW